MDRPFADARNGQTLREIAVEAIERTRWVPKTGENRIKGMVANKPDWVLSRQRAWGVPLAIFVRKGGHEVLYDEEVNARIAAAFEAEGADAWFAEGAKERFLGDEARSRRLRQDRQPGGGLVQLRLDPRLRPRGPGPFPRPRRHPADHRRRSGRGDVSRGLGPASRLVPIVAARELRHARPRALRRRPHPRLHARREGPQDVQVAGEPDVSRRTSFAPRARTSSACGWRASTIPTTSASGRRS